MHWGYGYCAQQLWTPHKERNPYKFFFFFFCFLGRGRAKDSKIIMLAYGDSGHVKRERENAIRVQLTQDILTEIHSLPPDVLVKDVIVFGFRTSLLYRQ